MCMYSKPFTTPLYHPPCSKPLFIPVWWGQLRVTPSIPWTPLVSLDYIVGYHLHLIPRSFVEYIVYHAASSSTSHIAQLLLHSSIRRIQHSVVESVVYCTTSSSSSFSTRQHSERFRQRETGGVPGRGGGVIGENNMAGRGGPFWGPFGAPYPRGGPPQGGPSQSGQAGGPPQGGQVGWGPQGGAGQGAAGLGKIYMHPCSLVSLGLANPVGTGGGYNQMSAPSLPSPFGIGGRWGKPWTGKSCRNGRRVQSDVRSLPTVTV